MKMAEKEGLFGLPALTPSGPSANNADVKNRS